MLEMKKELQFKIASFAIVFATPVLVATISISLFQALGGYILSAQNVFTLLFLLNTLRYPLLFLPNAERNINGKRRVLNEWNCFFNF